MQSGRRHALRALRVGGPVRGAATLLHESRIPTDHFQDSLPKMPVPALSDTLSKFLYFAEPLVSDDEHLLARRGVSAFAGAEGPALQAELLASSERQYTSYISAPWFDMYLRDRAPRLLNYNPQLTFEDEAARPSQANRAARLCHAAGRFLLTLEAGEALDPDAAHTERRYFTRRGPRQAGVLEPDVFHTKPKVSQTPLWREAVRLMPRSVAFYGAAATGAYALDMSQCARPLPPLDAWFARRSARRRQSLID